MQITVDKNVVEFKPEHPHETAALEILWRVMVDCNNQNRKMTPIGEYIPTKENLARFHLEGIPGGKTTWSDEISPEDCTYYCSVCNKYMKVGKGGAIPNCCGRVMEILD